MAKQKYLPPALADVAFIDSASITVAAAISKSTWLELVRTGKAPQPVIRGPRFTRWKLCEIRDWLRQRAELGADPVAAEKVARTARLGSAAAQRKRASSVPAGQ